MSFASVTTWGPETATSRARAAAPAVPLPNAFPTPIAMIRVPRALSALASSTARSRTRSTADPEDRPYSTFGGFWPATKNGSPGWSASMADGSPSVTKTIMSASVLVRQAEGLVPVGVLRVAAVPVVARAERVARAVVLVARDARLERRLRVVVGLQGVREHPALLERGGRDDGPGSAHAGDRAEVDHPGGGAGVGERLEEGPGRVADVLDGVRLGDGAGGIEDQRDVDPAGLGDQRVGGRVDQGVRRRDAHAETDGQQPEHEDRGRGDARHRKAE